MRRVLASFLRATARRVEGAQAQGEKGESAAPGTALGFVDQERGYDLGETGAHLLSGGVIQDPETRDVMQLDLDSEKVLVEQFDGAAAEVGLDFFLTVASAYESVRVVLGPKGSRASKPREALGSSGDAPRENEGGAREEAR